MRLIFVQPYRFIDLIWIKVGVPIRIQLAVGLVLRATHNASVRHGGLKAVEIVEEQTHTLFVAYFVNILRKLCEVLKNLLVFVDSNTDLLRRVWAPWPARGNEHGASLLKTLICYHLTSFIDLTELIIILDEILNVIALVVLMTAFGVFLLVRIHIWARSGWNNVPVFFKIQIVT